MSVYNISGSMISVGYAVDGSLATNAYNISGSRIGFDGEDPAFYNTAVLSALSSCSADGNKQGSCTDGTYIYQMAGDASSYTYMQIIKYKISDGTYTATRFDGTPNFGHANDMAYNPNNGYLYICTMLASGAVIVIDSSDMSYVDTLYATDANGDAFAIYQICYDRLTNQFYSIYGTSVFVYDSTLTYVSTITIPQRPTSTAQGGETDGTFIYRITYNPNYIDVLRVSNGERVITMNLPTSGEPETMMYDWNGNYYISQNVNGIMFYSAQLYDA